MDRIGIGIVGYGMIGRVHAINYKELPLLYPGQLPEIDLVGVCTSREETAKSAQQETGAGVWSTDVEEFVNRDDIDVIDCSAPNQLHRDVALAALKAGKHVYCEKPLARSGDEARELYQAARNASAEAHGTAGSGPSFGMTFNYRFIPAILRAKQLIDEGRIGGVYTYRAEYLHTGYQDPNRPLGWKLKKEEGGSGALADLGSHVIDLVRYLLGEYRSVQANFETFIKERPVSKGASQKGTVTVDDVAWFHARMESGAVGTVEASRFATGTLDDLRIRIHGEKGALFFDLMEPDWLWWYDEARAKGDYGGERGWLRLDAVQNYPGAAAPPPRSPIGWIRSHAENQYRFLRSVAEGSPPSPDGLDGLRTQLVMDAAERSNEESGAWTEVPKE